jgi:hypothetical protein
MCRALVVVLRFSGWEDPTRISVPFTSLAGGGEDGLFHVRGWFGDE